MNSSKVARNAEHSNALCALANNGFVRVFSAPQPASPDKEAGGTLLAEFRLKDPAFDVKPEVVADGDLARHHGDVPRQPSARTAPLTVQAFSLGSTTGVGTGAAAWFRVLKADGKTALCDGTVGLSGAELNLNAIEIRVGQTVAASGMAIRYPLADAKLAEDPEKPEVKKGK